MAKPTHARTSAASPPRTHAISAAVLADAIGELARLVGLTKGARALLERDETDALGRTDIYAADHVLATVETGADRLLHELMDAECNNQPEQLGAPIVSVPRMGAAA